MGNGVCDPPWALSRDQQRALLGEGLRPVGEGHVGVESDPKGHRHDHDRPLDRPKRACAKCGNRFQPTVLRRLLCLYCFGQAD